MQLNSSTTYKLYSQPACYVPSPTGRQTEMARDCRLLVLTILFRQSDRVSLSC